jgi:hypothetical protein
VSTAADEPGATEAPEWTEAVNLSGTAAASDKVMVVWTEQGTCRILTRSLDDSDGFSQWSDTLDLSQTPDTTCDWAAVSIAESTIVTFQKKLTGTDWDIIADINGNRQMNLTSGTQPGTYGHPVFELHDDTLPIIHLLWNRDLSAATSEAAYQRYQLGLENGGYGGGQSTTRIDPSIKPELAAPYPNPFSNQTTIRYATNRECSISLKVHDLGG